MTLRFSTLDLMGEAEVLAHLDFPNELARAPGHGGAPLAEDYGKEIIVAIFYQLSLDADELEVYRERQIVDLSLEPKDATFIVEHNGQRKAVSFNQRTL